MVGNSQKARLRAFGAALKRLRVARGYSQETMAELAELTDDRFLRRIERGEVNVRFSTICKMADALAVEPSLLLRRPRALIRSQRAQSRKRPR